MGQGTRSGSFAALFSKSFQYPHPYQGRGSDTSFVGPGPELLQRLGVEADSDPLGKVLGKANYGTALSTG